MLIGDHHPGDPPLPGDLQEALREWGLFAVSAMRLGGPLECAMLRHWGRQLASRVADVLGRPVDFVDPLTGAVESIRVGATGPNPQSTTYLPDRAAAPPGPTPWATGLAVSAFFTVLVAMADIVLSNAFAEAFGLLWVPANLLVGLGLAPSLHLLRSTPFWRWPALGAAVGLGVAWLVLLLGMLG